MATDIAMLAGATDTSGAPHYRGGSNAFWRTKRYSDVIVALLAMPFMVMMALLLLLLNPIFNRGPLIFRQTRMGRDLQPFVTYKFRTMTPAKQITRRAYDPVELHRITPLGTILRKTRLDELPQFLNILKGDMSLIGPRPDFVEHAEVFLTEIPEYRDRHQIRPGLSGLAQVTIGYVEGVEETRFKAQADLSYIRNASALLDLKIMWLTLITIVTAAGH